jgi:hypothetical protein
MSDAIVSHHQRFDDTTFADDLRDWMSRAPYLAIALAFHLFAFFILAALPQGTSEPREEIVAVSAILTPPVDPFEEPEEQEIVELPPDEPEIVDPVFDDALPESEEDAEPTDDDMQDQLQSPFQNMNAFDTIGIMGGGAPGAGSKGESRRNRRGGRPDATEDTVERGLAWLADHQSPDGRWDCDGFMHETRRDGPICDGGGDAAHDVGVTGLALLTFLGIGDTLKDGQYANNIRRGVAWLLKQQDEETGLLGEAVGQSFLYDHSIATLALCEALHSDRGNPLLKRAAQDAVNTISRARNPYGAWRYALPADGSSDTSVTGWMVFALAAAHDAGLVISHEDLRGALSWIDEATDPVSGRTGYDRRGGPSARVEAFAAHYPAEAFETLTAVGMLSRIFAGDVVGAREHDSELLAKGADLVLERLPTWSDDGSTCDMYGWYYATYALFQYGAVDPRAWARFEPALERAILPNQRTEPPCYEGSWDPIGPWGHAGGRVYSTAMLVLCLEVHYRYGRLLGAREVRPR